MCPGSLLTKTLDLEDSVASTEKRLALKQVIEALAEVSTFISMLNQKPKHSTAEVAVRINKLGQLPLFEELESLAKVSKHIDAIVLPKYTIKGHERLISFIDQNFHKGTAENPKTYRIWGLAETPSCLVSLHNQLFSVQPVTESSRTIMNFLPTTRILTHVTTTTIINGASIP
jgi:citrate lyase beta subunit